MKHAECGITFKILTKIYDEITIRMIDPLQIYLKKKLFTGQTSICKSMSDLSGKLDYLIDIIPNDNDSKLPFALMLFSSGLVYYSLYIFWIETNN